MEIEYKNKNYKNKESIYKVGNVIEYRGDVYLVCETPLALGERKYFLVSLKTSKVSSLMFKTLEKLEESVSSVSDTLVKAKLIVDYKLDGDEESEDVEQFSDVHNDNFNKSKIDRTDGKV